jgi:hypothetical protein
MMQLLQAFPFPSTPGEVTLHPLSQACLFIYSSFVSGSYKCGVFLPLPLLQAFPVLIAGHVLLLLPASVFVYSSCWRWVFPPLLWGFPPSTTLISFPCSWLLCAPTLSGQARLVYLHFQAGFPSPSFGAQGTPPSLLHVFIVLIAYYSVSLFSPGGDRSVQGAMLIWPRVVCGSTAYHLAHLVVHVFPSHLGTGNWQQPRGLPGFSVQHEVRCSAQAGGVEGSKFCLLLVTLPARCVSSISPRFHFRRHAFCFLTLAAILEIPIF